MSWDQTWLQPWFQYFLGVSHYLRFVEFFSIPSKFCHTHDGRTTQWSITIVISQLGDMIHFIYKMMKNMQNISDEEFAYDKKM